MSDAPDSTRDSGQIFTYFSSLTFLVYLVTPTGYLLDIVTSYILKNQLHATVTQVSFFRLAVATPVYLAFVFGLARDRWNPLGLRDRGHFLLFAPATALAFVWMAWSELSFTRLVVATVLVMLLFRFVMAGYQGLVALVGQENLMSGRLAAVWQFGSMVPAIAGAFASGYLTEHFTPSQFFLLMAVLSLLIAAMGLWKPRAVFSHVYDRPLALTSGFVVDLKRLVKHRAVYPALLINLLWNFMPGMNTPLQFHLSEHLHAPDSVYANFIGLYQVFYLPVLLLYGFLCKKAKLRTLLIWGTIFAIPQLAPLAFLRSANTILLLAVPIGLMGGFATAAYFDLAIRSCPAGLQGTLMMLVDGILFLSWRGGDLVGSWIYGSSPTHGFTYCILLTCAIYTLILPLIFLAPKELIATADGEPNLALATAEAIAIPAKAG